ncbi:hypothetical protein Leryth_000698 [Lithospermum erythrorhizon]|nr:hypothetical protein Leryth_000698 [Lithospermum erythrorhizon]
MDNKELGSIAKFTALTAATLFARRSAITWFVFFFSSDPWRGKNQSRYFIIMSNITNIPHTRLNSKAICIYFPLIVHRRRPVKGLKTKDKHRRLPKISKFS